MPADLQNPTATPGPWVWRWKSGSLHQRGEPPYDFGATVLCPTYDYDSGVDVQVSEADARLIAAAPDMQEAAEQVIIAYGMGWGLDGVIAQLRAALPADSVCRVEKEQT